MLKKIRVVYSNICINNREFLKQLLIIELYIVLFWNAALFSEYSNKEHYIWILFWSVLWNGSFLLTLYSLLKEGGEIHLKENMMKNLHLLVVFLLFLLLFITVSDAWLNLDGFIYYSEIRGLKYWDFMHFKDLMIAGHCSQGYTMLLMIGEFLFPDQVIGVRLVHLIMAFITIYSFDRIIDKILYSADRYVKILCTAVFSFSPMLLGIIAEINTDFPLLCILIWMIYCSIYGKYFLQAFCGLLLCFSKEPGVILFVFYLLGILLFRIWKYRKKSFKDLMLSLFTKDIMLNLLSVFLWVFNIIMIGNMGWINNAVISESEAVEENLINSAIVYKFNSFSFWPEYIKQKFLGLFGINFGWIFYMVILTEIVLVFLIGRNALFKKIKIQGELLIGIIFSFCGFLFYNCTYITYLHYRYLLPLAFFSTFGMSISIVNLLPKIEFQRFFLTLVMIIVLASNFVTFDPLSKLFFTRYGTGVTDIINPQNLVVGADGNTFLRYTYNTDPINTNSVYNLEYAYMGKCFDKALKQIDYNERKAIIIPCEYRESYGTIATLFGINVLNYNTLYWDTAYAHVNINTADRVFEMSNDERYQLLNIYTVEDKEEIDEINLKIFDEIYYFELPWVESYDHGKILNYFELEDQFDVQYISWKWKVDKIVFNGE